MDLLEMIRAAYDYPQAVRSLYVVVAYLYPDDPHMSGIGTLVDAIELEPLLRTEERQSLHALLSAVEPTVVATAFYDGTGLTPRQASVDPSDVAAIVAAAEDHPVVPDHVPALFDFVDAVAHRSTRATRTGLHLQLDRVAQRQGISRAAVDKLCVTTENRVAKGRRFYLVAELKPDQMRAGHFFLAAWRQRENEPEEVFYVAKRSVRWERAVSHAYHLIQKLAADVENVASEQVLELVLPRELVTEAVDQVTVDSVLPSPVGTTYPIVLRSLDRLQNRQLFSAWRRNWNWLKEFDRTGGIAAIYEIKSHDQPAVHALRVALLQQGPPAVVLMLSEPPVSKALTIDAYTAALWGGASIVLWSRDAAATAKLAESVRDACAESLLGIRDHVFNLRLQAVGDSGAATGAHITLVFDDYDRIPEAFRGRARMRSPAQRSSEST